MDTGSTDHRRRQQPIHAPRDAPGRSVDRRARGRLDAIPGTELVSGPTDVTVGDIAASRRDHHSLTTSACAPDEFYLWYDAAACGDARQCYRWVSASGETDRVWIVEVDGTDPSGSMAETYKGAGPEPAQEIQQIVDSIRFE